MPATLSYPGVYVEEIPSGVRTIVGVPTSVTAFIGRTKKGPVEEATDITSWQDFERKFGGLWPDSQLPFAVRDFYLNGGTRAVIVRLYQPTHETPAEEKAVVDAIAQLKRALVGDGKRVKASVNKKLGDTGSTDATTLRGSAKIASDVFSSAPTDENKKEKDITAAAVKAVEAAKVETDKLADDAKDEVSKTTVSDAIATAMKKAGEVQLSTEDEKAAAARAIADLKGAMSGTGGDLKEAVKKALGKEDGSEPSTIRGAEKTAADAAQNDPNNEDKKKAKANAKAALGAAETAGRLIDRLDNAAQDEYGKAHISDTIKLALATGGTQDRRELSIGDALQFEAMSPGKWGGYLRLVATQRDPNAFDLTVTDTSPGGSSESFLKLSVADGSRRVDKVLENESQLLRWKEGKSPTALPDFASGIEIDPTRNPGVKSLGDPVGTAYLQLVDARNKHPNPKDPAVVQAKEVYDKALEVALASVTDGNDLTLDSFLFTSRGPGIRALEDLYTRDGLFNLLCIPPFTTEETVVVAVIAAAASYCEERRAMLLVDPPKSWTRIDQAVMGFNSLADQIGTRSKNAAIFFPRIKQPNPFHDNQIEEFAPCGVVAGIFARTDTERGVWKAPAGIEATLKGVSSLKVPMTDLQNGMLNPLGINCLRHFPVYGQVVWGSRTLDGADAIGSEWKYIPVKRTALFIEESLFRGTKWVVFQPNDEPLWSQIRLAVGAFMHNLFRQGAFQGRSPREAYFVKCDGETTTQHEINLGIVNISVGFAPLKPCEFVVIKLQQMAGQIEV